MHLRQKVGRRRGGGGGECSHYPGVVYINTIHEGRREMGGDVLIAVLTAVHAAVVRRLTSHPYKAETEQGVASGVPCTKTCTSWRGYRLRTSR